MRIILAAGIGTFLEWYEFSLFAFFMPLFANYFFPKDNALTSLMLTYAIFAVGFFVRPLGAILFGHLGDRIGRKKALIYSIALMAFATFLMGLLPTYEHIGVMAPVMLILLRIAQGLSAGGESTGAVLFVLEANQNKKPGFMGGLLWSVTGIGMLCGSLMAAVVHFYPEYPWAWRLPFLLSFLTAFVGYFIRKNIPESFFFQDAMTSGQLKKFPLYEGIIQNKIPMLRIIGMYSLSAMITYLVFVFMPTYAANIHGLTASNVIWVCNIALATNTFLVPLGGYLSDCLGRKKTLRFFAISFFLLSYPLFLLITRGQLNYFIFAEVIFVLLAIGFQGPMSAFAFDQVPIAVRYSMMAVGYNVAYSVFGGTIPIVVSFLINASGYEAVPGLYLMFGASLALIATINIPNDVVTK